MKNISRFVAMALFIQAGLAFAAWPLTYTPISTPVDTTNSGQYSLGSGQNYQYLSWTEDLNSGGAIVSGHQTTYAEITSQLYCDNLTPVGVMDFDYTKDHTITSWAVPQYVDTRPPEQQTGATFDVHYKVTGLHWQEVHPYLVPTGNTITCGYGIYAYAKPKFRATASTPSPYYTDGDGYRIAFSGEYYKPGISITGVMGNGGYYGYTINRNQPIDVEDVDAYPSSVEDQWDSGAGNPAIQWTYDDGSNMSGVHNTLQIDWELTYDSDGATEDETDIATIFLFNEQTAKTQERIDLTQTGTIQFSASAISYNRLDFEIYADNIVNKP